MKHMQMKFGQRIWRYSCSLNEKDASRTGAYRLQVWTYWQRCQCGKGKKPDILLKLKGHGLAVYSTGALICLHSKRSELKIWQPWMCWRSRAICNEVSSLSWTLKTVHCCGSYWLKGYCWFKCSNDGVNLCTVPTSQVRHSLSAFLTADPIVLDVNENKKALSMPASCDWKTILGCGRTSMVHEFECDH